MDSQTPVQKTKVFRVKVDVDKGKAFEDQCKNEGTNINAKLKGLIDNSLGGQRRYFVSGKNEIRYNRFYNNFSWLVRLDSGKEIEILSNLSDSFLKNLKGEIEQALQQRNDWVHQTKSGSISIPERLIGGNK